MGRKGLKSPIKRISILFTEKKKMATKIIWGALEPSKYISLSMEHKMLVYVYLCCD